MRIMGRHHRSPANCRRKQALVSSLGQGNEFASAELRLLLKLGSDDKPSGGLGNSQDLTNLLGKILRIDPFGDDGPGGEYGIPANNPFVGGAAGE